MKNIAILFEGNIYSQRGEFIAIRNRIREYEKQGKFHITVYVFWPKVGLILNGLFHFNEGKFVKEVLLDDITYHCLWYRKSITDLCFRKLFNRDFSIEAKRMYRLVDLSAYDIVYANSLKTGMLAQKNRISHNVPYVVAWHGSSIHTLPFLCKTWYKKTEEVLKNADFNFYVSKDLQELSYKITPNKGDVSLNGIDTGKFYRYSEERITRIKKELKIKPNSINVAFVGNLIYVKYAEYLPYLFSTIKASIQDAECYVVGRGDFTKYFANMTYVHSFTDISYERMPDIYNCMDLIVMPSRHEGLPMTCLEAKACGVLFIGSRVGGIADVVGEENTVVRDDLFDNSFAEKCISALQKGTKPSSLDNRFSLSSIVDYESNVINAIMDHSNQWR